MFSRVPLAPRRWQMSARRIANLDLVHTNDQLQLPFSKSPNLNYLVECLYFSIDRCGEIALPLAVQFVNCSVTMTVARLLYDCNMILVCNWHAASREIPPELVWRRRYS